ncbi:MAG: DMT family transporter [Thalassobaculales bacterium]
MKPLHGILFKIAGVALLVVALGLIKVLGDRYPVFQLMFIRASFGLLVAFALAQRHDAGLRTLLPRRPLGHLTRAMFGLVGTFCMVTAIRYLPLADIWALGASAPLLVTALSVPLLGEQVGWRRWTAVLVGLVGVLIILRPGAGVFQTAALLPLADALCYALSMITIRKLTATDSTLSIMCSFSLIVVLATGLAMPFQWVAPSAADWLILLAIGVLGAFGQLLIIRAFALAPANLVAPFDYTGMLWMILVGAVFFGEFPDAMVLLGSALVVASGLYVLWREAVKARGGGA